MYKKLLINTLCRYPLSICLFLCLGLGACGDTITELPQANAAAYYPLSVGKTWIYTLDSTIYDPQPGGLIKVDTAAYWVKEVVADTFRDASQTLVYRIERFERPDTNSRWEIKKVSTAALTPDWALRTENNVKYIKFPLVFKQRTTWDGNIFADDKTVEEVEGELLELFAKKWTYEIISFDKKESIGGLSFDSVLTVRAQIDTRILTERRYRLEKYAKNVGLVFREDYILDTQRLDPSVAWEQKAEKGYILRQRIRSYQ